MGYDPRYLDGISQFNRRDFYAAHDAWESLWLETTGEEKDFLQGLILCAVALHHYSNRNFNGARSRFRHALTFLEGKPSPYWGMDLAKFLRRMNGSMHRLLTEEDPPPLDLKRLPSIPLRS